MRPHPPAAPPPGQPESPHRSQLETGTLKRPPVAESPFPPRTDPCRPRFRTAATPSASGEDGLLQGPGRCPPGSSSSTRRRRRRHCDQAGRMAAGKAGSQPAGRKLRLDGKIIAHNNEPGHCPGSGEQPADDTPLACWLPVKDGLTPHGLRHGHKTLVPRTASLRSWPSSGSGTRFPGCAACTPTPRSGCARNWPRLSRPGGTSPSGSAPPSTRTPRSPCSTTC
jgi:hypothetical protein